MITSFFELPVFGSEDAISAPSPSRDRFAFSCCACGSVQSAAHLVESEAKFVASGLLLCLRCSVMLRVTIVGEKVTSERESTFQARARRLVREVRDAGY